MSELVEKRFVGTAVEVRADEAGVIRVVGYAAKFNEPTDIGGAFMEVVKPGAFSNALKRGDDVEFLVNHEGLPIARNTAGNLRLTQDSIGLRIEADLDPADPDVARIVSKMRKKGMLDQMSFAFQVSPGGQRWDESGDGLPTRSITDVTLYDVSIVNRGAYPTTSIALRSLTEARKDKSHPAHKRIAERKMHTEQVARGIR